MDNLVLECFFVQSLGALCEQNNTKDVFNLLMQVLHGNGIQYGWKTDIHLLIYIPLVDAGTNPNTGGEQFINACLEKYSLKMKAANNFLKVPSCSNLCLWLEGVNRKDGKSDNCYFSPSTWRWKLNSVDSLNGHDIYPGKVAYNRSLDRSGAI